MDARRWNGETVLRLGDIAGRASKCPYLSATHLEVAASVSNAIRYTGMSILPQVTGLSEEELNKEYNLTTYGNPQSRALARGLRRCTAST